VGSAVVSRGLAYYGGLTAECSLSAEAFGEGWKGCAITLCKKKPIDIQKKNKLQIIKLVLFTILSVFSN
jgi:hypothetical protein